MTWNFPDRVVAIDITQLAPKHARNFRATLTSQEQNAEERTESVCSVSSAR
jgi:hypothetical protein